MQVTPNGVTSSINGIIRYLVEAGLATDQQFAFQRTLGSGTQEVTFDGGETVGVALKGRDYEYVYDRFRRSRAYNVRMPDGALIQMMYGFVNDALMSHRLAFFPTVRLERFQREPEMYMSDELFGHELSRIVVAFPMRFDYNAAKERHRPIVHPKSHLTLGEFRECRIPVSAPVSPRWFMDFVLRNFYDTPDHRYADELPGGGSGFGRSIDPQEQAVVHLVVPS